MHSVHNFPLMNKSTKHLLCPFSDTEPKLSVVSSILSAANHCNPPQKKKIVSSVVVFKKS